MTQEGPDHMSGACLARARVPRPQALRWPRLGMRQEWLGGWGRAEFSDPGGSKGKSHGRGRLLAASNGTREVHGSHVWCPMGKSGSMGVGTFPGGGPGPPLHTVHKPQPEL